MISVEVQKQIDIIKEKCKRIRPLVVIRSITYNHEKFIRDALDGFIMQKTEFPFVVIVHDDASTDGTAEILHEYAEKYPDIIFPIFETENQWSKHDGSLRTIVNTATEATGAKYVALCEGDDYWIDPLKIQKQTDFLETHPDYSLCVTNTKYLKPDGTFVPSPFNTSKSCDLLINDIILKGGLYISTPTIFTLSNLILNVPYKDKNFHVGDYPLQIYLASVGKVRNLYDLTTVYRLRSASSWSNSLFINRFDYNLFQTKIKKEIFMLDSLDEVLNYRFHNDFRARKLIFVFQNSINFSSTNELKIFIKHPVIILKNFKPKTIFFSFLPKSLKQYLSKKLIK